MFNITPALNGSDGFCGTQPPAAPDGPHHDVVSPFVPTRGQIRIAMLELSRASTTLNPVMPMWIGVDDDRYVDYATATRHASAGVAAIDAALANRDHMSTQVFNAVSAAAEDARAGLQQLATRRTTDRFQTIAHFDAATNWLSIADRLIELELGGTVVPFSTRA